ncbi:Rieske (2Fe-2S) protein [Saccharopolyspora spinosa]|uniref:3-phenylpropionate/trans-cinnamate dioxygenase ferredoxin subunit n=1 Tax=Saccharopolyspora spinosa TaxID=60894 RepID=A0A2N3Y0R5_SACSN|nr:Rieske (2Fe-2S) protein [Saccharopolyspora spinosa]PKW16509.1 3-phenylpropionate/trans-cinnamate dioxygenase ferredoxin subunit [Saccharopolyspora spinosa]
MTTAETRSATTPARHANRFVVARVDEIPPGDRRIVDVGGRQVGVYNVGGRFYAMLNRCPHLAGPLCEGQVVNAVESSVPGDVRLEESRTYVTCPWHNWEFDVETGQSYWNPRLRARPLPVGVEGGAEIEAAVQRGEIDRLPGPFQAEMVPVSVESDYVVLSLRPARGGNR